MIELEATMIFLRSSGISLFSDWFSICWIWSVQYYESYTKYYIYTFWYNFDTVLCQFLETGTSDRCLSGIVQLLRLTGFSLYPLSFFLYSPFDRYSRWRRKSSRINATMTKKEIVIVEHTKINFVIYISMLFAVILT